MRVLVTGGRGFLGTALCERLGALGHEVLRISSGAQTASLEERLSVFRANLGQTPRPDLVYHLAGTGLASLSPACHQWANLETSRELSRRLLDLGYRGPVILASSASVYGETGLDPVCEDFPARPCSLMGASKLAAEACLSEALGASCQLRIARLFNVFGPGQSKLVVYEFARRIVVAKDRVTLPGGREKVRDFLSLEQTLRAMVGLGQLPEHRGPLIVNLCSGRPLTIENLAKTLLKAWGKKRLQLDWEPENHTTTAAACVGNPQRLRALGLKIAAPTLRDYRETLKWCVSLSSVAR